MNKNNNNPKPPVWRRALGRARGVIHIIKRKLFGIPDYRWSDYLYQRQLRKDAITPARMEQVKMEYSACADHPKISIVVPVYNIDGPTLERAIQSVLDQYYHNWELCIADDASPKRHIKPLLKRYMEEDDRIKVVFLENNLGMSGSSNEALKLATGEYVALLDHDDELSPDALFEVVKCLNTHRDAELIYSDEDKLTMSGKRLRPVYKGDWDPDLFLTYNYFCHLVVCKRELMEKVNGFRVGFEGSQDYDILLRITELTEKIYHIPKILYHWRMIPGSAAMVVDAKGEAFEKSKRALRDAMERRGIDADVVDGDLIGTFKVIYK